MRKVIIVAALVGVLGACTTLEVLTSSETHISNQHWRGRQNLKDTFTMAEDHCQKYGKIAIHTVSGGGGRISTFKCE